MKKLLVLLAMVVVLHFGVTDVGAISFTFSGLDAGGTGSATMDLTLVGTELTIVLNNTSPTTTDSGNPNIPAIVGFGFDVLNNSLPGITRWSLTADEYNGMAFSQVTLGADPTAGLDVWDILVGGQLEGVALDYFPNNSGGDSNIAGALYNPDIVPLPNDASDSYYTTAVLIMNFDAVPVFDFDNNTNREFSPYVRMQRVGDNAAGSLKLIGEEDDGGGGGEIPVPEPTTMLLIGTGLVAFGIKGRKKIMK